MTKTLAEIMSEPANVEEIIRTATAINKLIEDSKKAGVIWPEVEEDKPSDEFMVRIIEGRPYKIIEGHPLCLKCDLFNPEQGCKILNHPCGGKNIIFKKL
jgi:hypothetical protein